MNYPLRSATVLLLLAWLITGPASAANQTLLELVERRAVMSLDFGAKHPEAVGLDAEISERIASGEKFNLDRASGRLEELTRQREQLRRQFGPAHRDMVTNALRIRAVAGILQDYQHVPGSRAISNLPDLQLTADPTNLGEDLEYSTAAAALLQQLHGQWEVESLSIKGHVIDAMFPEQFSINDRTLQYEYPAERLSQVPAEHRDTFQKPWQAIGFHSKLQAIEFRKVTVSKIDNWKSRLSRRFVAIDGDKLVIVCIDDPKLPPTTLKPTADNYVFHCKKKTQHPTNR